MDHYVAGNGTDLDEKEVYLDYNMIRNDFENNLETYNWLVDNDLTSAPFNDYSVTPDGKVAGTSAANQK